MGRGTRQQEIKRRRHRRIKRQKERLHQRLDAVKQGETREERRRLIRELQATEQPEAASATSN